MLRDRGGPVGGRLDDELGGHVAPHAGGDVVFQALAEDGEAGDHR
jgi:hypothetical protein